jgi:uncharacterized protein YkwD
MTHFPAMECLRLARTAAGVPSLLLACLVTAVLATAAARADEAEVAIAARLLTLVNATREREGLLPLRIDARLMQAAQGLADDLAARRVLSHTDRRGGRPPARFARVGYAYSIAEEAVAGGQASCEEVVAAWLASPSHRAILLDPGAVDAGVGYVFRVDDKPGRGLGYYWVIDLGRALEQAP